MPEKISVLQFCERLLIDAYTTINMHSSHADPFNYSNGPKLARRYSDHAV
jgi:hypothetical protein